MDLVSVHPVFNLYNKRWPIRGVGEPGSGEVRHLAARPRSRWSARAASSRRHRCATRAVEQRGHRGRGLRRGQRADARRPGGQQGGGAPGDPGQERRRGPGEMVGVDLERDRSRFAISSGGVVAVGRASSSSLPARGSPWRQQTQMSPKLRRAGVVYVCSAGGRGRRRNGDAAGGPRPRSVRSARAGPAPGSGSMNVRPTLVTSSMVLNTGPPPRRWRHWPPVAPSSSSGAPPVRSPPDGHVGTQAPVRAKSADR